MEIGLSNASAALERLVPTPRSAVLTSAPVSFDDVRFGVEPGYGDAAMPLRGLRSATPGVMLAVHIGPDAGSLPPEGYTLTVGGAAGEPTATIAAADPAGAFYGAQTLAGLVTYDAQVAQVPGVVVRDWPELSWRGTIEGFYGPPWSQADRLAHLRFAAAHKMNTYVYAPKDDPFHRARWREPYPAAELDRLRELVATARAAHVRFVFTISPGLSMVYSDPAELDRLFMKLEQVWDIGVRDIGLLFDDIEPELVHEADIEAFGASAGSSARAHVAVCREVHDRFLGPRGSERPLLMVPTDYAGVDRSAYRDLLARELPGDVLVWWTGRDIVVGDVTRPHIDAAAESYGHRLLLWDNFPVNDFDSSRLFLGPLVGRTGDLAGASFGGVTANPMPHAAASEIALATVADWAWNPTAYDPALSHRRVRDALGGGPAIESLIDACSAWPPSTPRYPELSALIAAVLNGQSAEGLEAIFRAMTSVVDANTDQLARLVGEVRPWLEAQAAMGQAGLAALHHLRSPSAETRAVAGKALAAAQAHEVDVLKAAIPPFVERILQRH